MLALADMGGAGRLLLVVIVVLVLIFAGIVVWLLEPLWRRVPWLRGWLYHWNDRGERGASGAGVGLDVLPWQPHPLESMQLADDLEAWEPHRFAGREFLPDTTEDCWADWPHHPGLVPFAGDHGFRRPSEYPRGIWALPVPGPPATGPDEHGRGLASLSAAPPPVRPTDTGPLTAQWMALFEVAHDEYAGPAPVVVPPPAPAEWAGPVPPTEDDLARRAWVRAELSRQDADTANYLHDYAAELRAA